MRARADSIGLAKLGNLWLSNSNPNLFLSRADAHLDVALQPIVESHTGRIHGYEALLRHYDRMGLPGIHDLLDLAYANGALPELDMLLRKKAIEKFSRIRHGKMQTLFCNIDGRILENGKQDWNATKLLLEANGLSGSNFCLELSERFDNTDYSGLPQMLAQCRDQGIQFALDDFGQGYSGLRLLYDFPADFLKIDRFFISGIDRDSKKRLFVTSLVDVAHVLGIKVVAEGVETAAELHSCREIGCDLLQGYFISPPMLEPDPEIRRYVQVLDIAGKNRKQRVNETDAILGEMTFPATLAEGSSMDAVVRAFEAHPEQDYFPVVDSNNMPKGIISERDIKTYVYQPFGRELLKNKASNITLYRTMRRCPIADISSDAERLIDLVTDEVDEGVIITSDMKYCGFVSSKSLLRISNMMRLRQAQEENPLTRLPANHRIHDFMASALAKRGVDRLFCFFDFDNFKPFNDTYGFRMGDRAIVLFADLMKKTLYDGGWFCGHVGGDDFFAGVVVNDDRDQRASLRHLRETFARDAESFYDLEHRSQGYIVAEQRNGTVARFPLLSCSIAALRVPANVEVNNSDLISREIATLKKEAKSAPDGIACRVFVNGDQKDVGSQRAA